MARKRDKNGQDGGPDVIVKKYEIVEGGHHGGAWKVAYADFVTAMMAFFLLMWLLNATTEDQRKGLADYFSPSNLMAHSQSGSGLPFGGHTPFDKGSLASDRGAAQVVVGNHPAVELTEDGDDPVQADFHRARDGEGVGRGPAAEDTDADNERRSTSLGQSGRYAAVGRSKDGQSAIRIPGAADLEAARQRQEKAVLESAAQQIEKSVKDDPALADLAKQLAVDMTPDGLRIQILDEVKLPMFPSGSATPNERVRLLMQKVVPILTKLNQPISIAGHTDAQPFAGAGRTNWELSADRANATRRLLVDGGFPEARVTSVTGVADRDPLIPNDPMAAANRRIAILVLRRPPTDSPASPSVH